MKYFEEDDKTYLEIEKMDRLTLEKQVKALMRDSLQKRDNRKRREINQEELERKFNSNNKEVSVHKEITCA